ncbi:golgi apparatus membrane protein TVP18 [Emergomyces africanus]|uniref:Golgi apparatus membrane protein TVP18 n=1 Tax=Emergomyces africanus TaxID=1955775 RepID=A0A1B7P6B3_9EURO|nr:golgi apparatus membrane protein TVP18 [Emergomyces africanus]
MSERLFEGIKLHDCLELFGFQTNLTVDRTGVLCIILCFALGIANIFNKVIVFSIICLASSFVIVFIEIPLLLRICPTSSKFDAFIRRFTTNYMRALMYVILSAVQWLSLIIGASSLIAAAVVLLIAAAFYGLAGVTNQEFMGSKTLGGQGVAQMIV